MNLFDSHSHLNDEKFDNDREEVIKEICESGVKNFITAGYSVESSKKALEIANKYDFIYTTAGISPNDIPQTEEELWKQLAEIEQISKENSKKVCAIGEIGLDFSRQSYISRNKQCMYFEQIVRVCAEKDKLMSVHLRRAEEEAISILKKYRPRRCIIHWFNGNGEQLQQLVDIGCYFSLNSNMVTNEKNKEKLYLIPKTRVLIESDGPFTKIDGKKYTFNNLIKIYELVARYYNEPDIIKMVYANFRDILSK